MNRTCLVIVLLSVTPIIAGIVIGMIGDVWCGILVWLALVLAAFALTAYAVGKAVKNGRR